MNWEWKPNERTIKKNNFVLNWERRENLNNSTSNNNKKRIVQSELSQYVLSVAMKSFWVYRTNDNLPFCIFLFNKINTHSLTQIKYFRLCSLQEWILSFTIATSSSCFYFFAFLIRLYILRVHFFRSEIFSHILQWHFFLLLCSLFGFFCFASAGFAIFDIQERIKTRNIRIRFFFSF